MSAVNNFWRLVVLAAVAAGLGMTGFAGPASAADESVWLCKPGQADNPCLGKMDGQALQPNAPSVELGYSATDSAAVDCFYVYPTQSNQLTPNANFDADQELKDVAINQARQFSRVCDVYAPIYRQYTFNGAITPEVRDIAYGDVVQAWNDYLENYNNGRGVIIVGHSQGSMNLGRLLQEEIDPKPAVRDRVISSILPGANIYVGKGKTTGGQFQNIPECESGTQLNCVIAYSAYLNEPPANSSYGRVESGYWINPNPRGNALEHEVMCVNPAELLGTDLLEPLANLDVFLGTPEGEKPWLAIPDYYRGECRTVGDVTWLNVSRVDPSDPRPDLAGLIASSGGNLHLGDVNLALDSLVKVAQVQTDAYLARAQARIDRPVVLKKLNLKKKSLKASQQKTKTLNKKLRKAKKECRAAKRSGMKVKARCKLQKSLTRQTKVTKRRSKSLSRQVKSLSAELKGIDGIIG